MSAASGRERRRFDLIDQFEAAASRFSSLDARAIAREARRVRELSRSGGALTAGHAFDPAERSWIVLRAWGDHVEAAADSLWFDAEADEPDLARLRAGVDLGWALYDLWPDDGFEEFLDTALAAAFWADPDPMALGRRLARKGVGRLTDLPADARVVWGCPGWFDWPPGDLDEARMLECHLHLTETHLVVSLSGEAADEVGQRSLSMPLATMTEVDHEPAAPSLTVWAGDTRWGLTPERHRAFAVLLEWWAGTTND